MHNVSLTNPYARSFDPQPGERLPKEGRQAYRAFTVYRNMPAEQRGLRGVAGKLKKSKSLMERWSSQHKWVDRVREWDQCKEVVETDEQEDAFRQIVLQQRAAGETLADVGMKISGVLTRKLPELEAYLNKISLERLFRLLIRAGVMAGSFQKTQRDIYDLLPPEAPEQEEEEPRRREKGVTVKILDPCPCGKAHPKGDRQWPCESAKAYAAFKTYRELGEKRSVCATGRKRERHRNQMQHWAGRYEWRRRAEGYDQHRRRLAEGNDAATVEKLLRRQIGAANAVLQKLDLIARTALKRFGESENMAIGTLFKLTFEMGKHIGKLQKAQLEAMTAGRFTIDRTVPGLTMLNYILPNRGYDPTSVDL